MGAYHIGAYQALREQAFDPDWVCGTSIGAINGAIIAGNATEHRLEKLDKFWGAISRPSIQSLFSGIRPTWEHDLSFATTLLKGQPGFFTPRPVSPYFASPGVAATSFYDTSPLFETLAATVDFALLNNNTIRLSVGATDVESGRLTFFDTRKMAGRFGPEHVVASGSLPPGFPATPIDGRFYWDGGCVSNSPLDAVVGDIPSGHTVIFVIDLWSAEGPAPQTMDAVAWRAKQIQYASRTPHDIDALASKVNLRHSMRLLEDPAAGRSQDRFDVVHIVYNPGEDMISFSDAEFSRESIATRRMAGLVDMRRALAEQPWFRVPRPKHVGCLVHRMTGDGVPGL
jgi:NTE family protein